MPSVLEWSLSARTALLCVALGAVTSAGCAPRVHTGSAEELVRGRTLPMTPALRELAERNYQESRQIHPTGIARGAPDLKLIALTFDDGPHGKRTEELLKTMTAIHVHGTFFVVGKMAVKQPYLLQEEILQGSEVGNHTYDHIHITSLTEAQLAREVFSTNDVIKACTGRPAVLFRPPGGRISWGAYRVLKACGVVTVLWTDDPKDYLNPGKPDPAIQKVLLRRLLARVRGGSVVLLHDGILDTVAILPQFVAEMRARGYEFVTVTQLILAEQAHHRGQPIPDFDRLAGNIVTRGGPSLGRQPLRHSRPPGAARAA